MSIPEPGKKVRGSRTGSPINAVFDLLGRRWALGVVWNLGKESPLSFRDLQARCGGISPSILNARIKDLRQAGIVERTTEGYVLTGRGLRLREVLAPMADWSQDWAADLFGYAKEGACAE